MTKQESCMKNANKIEHVVLAGAGIMGASFAQIFARYGYSVTLYDLFDEALQKAKKLIEVNQLAMVNNEEITNSESQELVSKIAYSKDMESFRQADFVLEAIAEKMPIKHDFWSKVSQIVDQDVVLATNTSGMSINEISRAVVKPERFAGMHWVNPPHLIPLVEVIAGADTDSETLEIIKDVARSLNQKPVSIYKDPPGFVLNRLQFAVVREALHIVESGFASVEDVDAVMKYGLGLRYACIGPFETIDFGGLDTFYNVGSYLFHELSNNTQVPELLKARYDAGEFGVKSGRGFYDYGGEKAEEAIEKRDADFIKVTKALLHQEEQSESK